jgi:hypothetical protein
MLHAPQRLLPPPQRLAPEGRYVLRSSHLASTLQNGVSMKVARILVAALVGILGTACGGSGAGEDAPAAARACDGGACVSADADASPPATACTIDQVLPQTAGDCKKNTCDVSGAIVVVTDDSDVPAATEECSETTCVGGEKITKPKVSGATCKAGTCDGKGACAKGLGDACSDSSACGSGFCVDGVCCDTACRGECQACNVAGKNGVCSNVPYYEADPSFEREGIDAKCDLSANGGRCNGEGKCLRASGKVCQENAHCISNACSSLKCLGAKGEFCNIGADCVSGSCSGGGCQ